MSSPYYPDPATYRPPSPPHRGRSPPIISQRPQHYSSSAAPLHSQYSPPGLHSHYSPPRPPRQRTPSRDRSSLNDRRGVEYGRYIEREREREQPPPRSRRSLPWETSQQQLASPPRRHLYQERMTPQRDRYREPSPPRPSNTRQQYDYPSSREEYYTQPRYSPLQTYSSSPTTSRRPAMLVTDVDTWQPTPMFTSSHRDRRPSIDYGRRPPTDGRYERRPLQSSGSRESPICVDDMHEEWRPPVRSRTPPPRMPNWEERHKRQSSPVRMESRDGEIFRRDDSRVSGRAAATIQSVRRNESQPQIHPARRDIIEPRPGPPPFQSQGFPPTHHSEEVFATQAIPPPSQPYPQFHAVNHPPLTTIQVTTQPTRGLQDETAHRSSLEQLVQGKEMAETEMQILLRQQEDEVHEHARLLAQATYEAEVSEKVVLESQSRVQMLEAKQQSAQSTPRIDAIVPQSKVPAQSVLAAQEVCDEQIPVLRQSEVIPRKYAPPKSVNQSLVADSSSRPSRWDQKPSDSTMAPQKPFANSSTLIPAEPLLKQIEEKDRLKSKRKQLKIKKTSRPVSRDSSNSTSLTVFTNGEKNQFLNQMARHAAEIVFGSKGQPQAASTSYPASAMHGQSGKGVGLEKGASANQVSNGTVQKNDDGLPLNEGNPVKATSSKLPTLDITTTTSTTLSITNKLPPQIDGLLAQPDGSPYYNRLTSGPPRKRSRSIASSNSSHASRLSNSPFLSSILTSGLCTVCLEKDIPPLNRLARCSECSSLYHQSCHTPPLTRAILEEAGENWTCSMCKEKLPEIPEDEAVETTATGGGRRKLSVRLKRLDVDKTFEERVMVNKNSFSTFMKRHAEWKSPGSGKKIGVFEDVMEEETSVSPFAAKFVSKSTEPASGMDGRGERERLSDGVIGLNVPQKESLTTSKTTFIPEHITAVKNNDDGLLEETGVPRRYIQASEIKETPRQQEDKDNDRTATYSPPSILNQDLSPTNEDSLQQLSSAEPIPSIKPPLKAIPASQPSDSSQISSNLMNTDLVSPPAVRQRRKRNLVIEDSEEDTPTAKRPKTYISPKAAMKSAPSGRSVVWERPEPIKVPITTMSRSSSGSGRAEFAKKSSIVARKSGVKFRDSATPEQGDLKMVKEKESDVDNGRDLDKGMNLQSPPVSPIQRGNRRLPEPESPMSKTRSHDPGENQRFSLQLIISSGSHNDIPVQVDDHGPSGYTFPTPYRDPSSPSQRPPTPPSPKRTTRSQDKKNFDILSLVPKGAVPVIEDGKLAFREGCIDFKTGRLKRGVKKFKVGRSIPGELL